MECRIKGRFLSRKDRPRGPVFRKRLLKQKEGVERQKEIEEQTLCIQKEHILEKNYG